MKLLHTSDWHLGMSYKGIDISEDQKYFLSQIYQIIKDEKIDVVLHGGDVFDRKNAPVEAYNLYDEAVTKICGDLETDMVVVAGNHDSPERLSACNVLLRKTGLYVEGILSKEFPKVEYDDVEIFMLPWFNTEQVKYLFPEDQENIQSMQDAFKVVLDHIKDHFTSNKKHILVSHAFIMDADLSESDRAASIGYASAVSKDLFEGFDYVALGHIHAPQSITKTVRYSGTPMMYSFGKEESQEKSVTIIDTDDMEVKIVPIKLLHKRKTFKGHYDDIINHDYTEEELNAYVRVEIDDVYAGLTIQSELRSKFKNLLELTSPSFDNEDSYITMTIDELEEKSKDPIEIFKSFYTDVMKTELEDEHVLDLFNTALSQYEKGEDL